MVVVGMEEFDLMDETFQDDERMKRDNDDDESDQSQAKKRRKQSKPMRIPSECLSQNDVKFGVWAMNSKAGPKNLPESFLESNFINFKQMASRIPPEDNFVQYEESDGNSQSIDVRTREYNKISHGETFFPLNLSNIKGSPPKNSLEVMGETQDQKWNKIQSNLPPYNKISAEPIQMKSQLRQNNLLLQTHSSSLLLPNFKRFIIGAGESPLQSSHRIFNPEAFCDLCNKEFCNKYFLKTHRANKHGIYNETSGSNLPESFPSLPVMNYLSNNSNGSSLFPQSSIKKNFNPQNTGSKSNSGSARAFCNICQREFCNKYFVRRHKAKIHGIVDSNLDDSSDKLRLPQEKPETNDINLPSVSSVKNVNELVDDGLEETIAKVKKEQDNDSEHNMSPTTLNLLVSDWQQNEESREMQMFPDKLKKFSSNSTGAFCEICCKEYCNKYFLRTHMQKCHGIFTPEQDEKESGFDHFWNINQTLPLNLILRESKNERSETGEVSTLNSNNRFQGNAVNEPMGSTNIYEEQQMNQVCQENMNKSKIENPKSSFTLEKNNSGLDTPILPETNRITPDELPKLHAFLMKLNQNGGLDTSVCEVCNKDLGHVTLLEDHLLNEHSDLLEEISTIDDENSNFRMNVASKYDCTKCHKSFSSIESLEQHLSEHQTESKSIIRNGMGSVEMNTQYPIPERQNLLTPTSSFCEICKKELCNKYFMKTHMQRMHGISIENGAQIGGVVCDICNKELCSKYFLRVHKQNSHGIVEEVFLSQITGETKSTNITADPALRPSENELNFRYFSHFTEVCTICSRRFRSTKWLKAHLLNDHGEEGKDKWKEVLCSNKQVERAALEVIRKNEFPNLQVKNHSGDFELTENIPCTSEASKIESVKSNHKENEPLPSVMNKQYQCSFCNFTSPVLALLLLHEKSHRPDGLDNKANQCPLCLAYCETNEILESHMLTHHSHNPYSSESNSKYKDFAQLSFNEEFVDPKGKTDDNNSTDTRTSTVPNQSLGEAVLKCFKCSFVTHRLELYTDHLMKEHEINGSNIGSLQILRDALLQVANTSLIPASFAYPTNLGNFTMQPFVLEDKAPGPSNAPSTFLSSLVFLPVKEVLNKPITASFKLTPT